MDNKLQKKHESDMTRKEKRELERRKLASMNFKQKAEYILTYYKFHIAGIAVIIALAVGLAGWLENLKDETMLYVAIVNAPEYGENMMDDFKASIGDTQEHNKYQLDTSIFIGDGGGQGDYASQMKLVTLIGAGTADVLICPQDIYKEYEQQKTLMPIADVMGQEFVEGQKDICEEYAIRIEDNEVLKKYGVQGEAPGYFIVLGYAKHTEKVKQFVEFIME